jgi:hypothetical protein
VLITPTECGYTCPLNQVQQMIGLVSDNAYFGGPGSQHERPGKSGLLCWDHRAMTGEAKVQAKQIGIDGDRYLHRLDMPIRPPQIQVVHHGLAAIIVQAYLDLP